MNSTVTTAVNEALSKADPHNFAMLVSLTIKCYSAKKYDRKVSREISDNKHASTEAGRYNKSLIDIEKYLRPIQKLQGEMRGFHYDMTLPFMDKGGRILHVKNFEKYTEKMNEWRDQHDRMVSKFIDVYPQAVQEAKKFLGDMYDPDDYPPVDEIGGRFQCEYSMLPLPDVDDFRVSVPEDVKAEAADRITNALDEAMRDAWQRLYDRVNAIATKLPQYERGDIRTFKATLVENLSELVEIIPGLNLFNDPALDELAREARDKLTRYDHRTLKNNEHLRKTVTNDAQNILDKMTFQLKTH